MTNKNWPDDWLTICSAPQCDLQSDDLGAASMRNTTVQVLSSIMFAIFVALISACANNNNGETDPAQAPAPQIKDEEKDKKTKIFDTKPKITATETTKTCSQENKKFDPKTGRCSIPVPGENNGKVGDKKASDKPKIIGKNKPNAAKPAGIENCQRLETASIAGLIRCLRSGANSIDSWLTDKMYSDAKVRMNIMELYKGISDVEAIKYETGSTDFVRARFCQYLTFSRLDLSRLNTDALSAGAPVDELMNRQETDFLAVMNELRARGNCDEKLQTATNSPF